MLIAKPSPRKLSPEPVLSGRRSPLADRRKCKPEIDEPRSLEERKPEGRTPTTDLSRTHPTGGSVLPTNTHNRKLTRRDVRPGSSPLLARRSALRATMNRQTSSPQSKGRDRAALNEHRQGEIKREPKKGAGKVIVPPLPSPLRTILVPGEDASSPRDAKKSLDKTASESVTSGPGGVPEQQSRSRKPKTLIPPLLSPTLPPIVEQELVRQKMMPSKGELDGKGGPDPPVLLPKGRGATLKDPLRLPAPPPPPPPLPPSASSDPKKHSLVVTLKYGKRIVRRVQKILSMSAVSVKKVPEKERERGKEKSRTLDQGAPPPPPVTASAGTPGSSQARKRPKCCDSKTSPHAIKRPRMNEMVRNEALVPAGSQTTMASSTPSKAPATARVAPQSSIMQAQVETNALNPSMNQTKDPSSRPVDEATGRAAERMQRECQHFITLGANLKHQRDDIMGYKNRGEAGHANPPPSQVRKGCAIGVESLMAFIIGFKVLNKGRDMERKCQDFVGWESLIPHLRIMWVETRHYVPLQGLVSVLSATVLEELECVIVSSFPSAGDANQFPGWINRIKDLVKMRVQGWDQARQALAKMRELGWTGTATQLEQVGPWMNAEDVVYIGLKVLREWVDKESVEWAGEILESLKKRE